MNGVHWDEITKNNGPFRLRLSGSNRFVSKIDPNDTGCHPPGSIETVIGWGNPKTLLFESLNVAIITAVKVSGIDGSYVEVEPSLC